MENIDKNFCMRSAKEVELRFVMVPPMWVNSSPSLMVSDESAITQAAVFWRGPETGHTEREPEGTSGLKSSAQFLPLQVWMPQGLQSTITERWRGVGFHFMFL